MALEISRQTNEQGEGRYSLLIDGKPACEIEFRMNEGRRVLTHTDVRGEFEGQGLAGKVVRRALDDARAEGISIIPQCSYVERYIERHPDDSDLVDTGYWDQLRGR